MWDLDKTLVEDTIEAEMLEDRIHAIIIWDAESGDLFAARQRGRGGRPERSNGSVSGDMIKATAMINNGAKDIGEAIVFVSKKELSKQLQQSTLNGVLTLVVLIVVMVTIMTVVMSKLILTPINRLAKHADDISHGDLKQDIQATSNDEIGQLADAFQRMQISLRFAFKRLQNKT
jgi:methyl-accepting chemotaxis protein